MTIHRLLFALVAITGIIILNSNCKNSDSDVNNKTNAISGIDGNACNTNEEKNQKEITEEDKVQSDYYYNQGLYQLMKRNKKNAILEFTKAIDINPKNTVAYDSRGLTYIKVGELDNAFEDFCQVIELDPKNPEAYYSRANIFAKKKQFEKAIVDYTRAIKYKRNYINAILNRGLIYAEIGEYEKAVTDLKTYIKLAPDDSKKENVEKDIERIKKELDNK